MLKSFLLTLFFLLFLLAENHAQLYTPLVDSIPMRDGKKLAADIYVPAGCTQCPVILIQTPYNRLGYRNWLPLGIGPDLNSYQYAIVTVDWRGFYGSASAAVPSPNRGIDGYDVVEWIALQPWSNGRVGTWGPSALGKIQFQTAKENPPSLVCGVPQVAGPQFRYLEYFPGGVYRTEYVEQLDALGYGMSGLLLANPVYNSLWQISETATNYPSEIRVPMLMIGGWYDHNPELMLDFFGGIATQSPLSVRSQHRLLMGPWVHGGTGPSYVGSANQGELVYQNAAGWSDSLAMKFFDHHLRNINNGWNLTPVIQYYMMGENAWKNAVSWPPQGVNNVNFYLHSNGRMKNSIPVSVNDSISLTYDPADFSPTIGGATLNAALTQGPLNQALLVESRNDNIIFETEVTAEDLVLCGQPSVTLLVSSDKRDTDFTIRLTDVYPDGRSMLFGEGTRRLRFRNGYAATDTLNAIPGQIYSLNISLNPTCMNIIAGHKLRMIVTSSNYPRYDLNLNNGGTMYVAGDTLVARNTVYTNSVNSSFISLPLIGFSSVKNLTATSVFNSGLFPNPVTKNSVLSLTVLKPEKVAVKLYDISSRYISTLSETELTEGKNSFTIDADSYAAGVYFIEITGALSGKEIIKMIKQ